MERSLFAGVHINKKRFQRDIDLFQTKGSHAAGPTSTSKLGDILDYFKTASSKSADPSALQGAAVTASNDVQASSSFGLSSNGGTKLGVGVHASKKKRKRATDQSGVEGDASEAVHVFHRKQKSAKLKEAAVSEPKSADSADIEAFAILRKKYQIHVSGQGIPPPLTGFGDLRTKYGCKKYLLRNLAEARYQEPSPIQRQAIPALLEGRECFACAPTGSGKTMAFLIPLLIALKAPDTEGGLRAVILCPTRELAQQSARELKKLCKGTKFKLRVMTKATAKSEGFEKVPCDILISTPLRLNGMIKEGKIDLSRVMHLVLDEADKLFELGFVDQIDAIVEACTRPGVVRSLFSATLPETVEELARSVMQDPIRITVGERNAAASTVKQSLLFVGTEEGKLLAIRQMFQQSLNPPVLLFVQSKERAQQLFKELVFDGIKVDVIHADRTQAQREAVVEKFRVGKTWVLIATDIMSRGMDFKGIACVINYDFPQSTLSYVHRIGRSGRAGRPGEAVTLYTNEDRPLLKSVANIMVASGCEVPQWILDLPKERRQRGRRRGGGEAAPPKRKDISTVPKGERMKAKQRREMIDASKRRKAAKEVKGDGDADGK